MSPGVENYFPRLWGMGISDAIFLVKHSTRDACLYIQGNQAPPAPRFVFFITCDRWADSFQIWQMYAVALGNFCEHAAVTF